MIKHYSFFANWRKKDVDFFNSLDPSINIKEGYFGFKVQNETIYKKIIEHYSQEDSFFSKNKPKDYSCTFATVSFTKKELDAANYFELIEIGDSFGNPQPENYKNKIFKYNCGKCFNNKTQIDAFRLSKTKIKNNQINFAFHVEPDFMFFKKDFYQEVLKPLGLQCRELIIHENNKISDNFIQLIIPEAKSNLLINGTTYDKRNECQKCGRVQYSNLTQDFFPAFEKDFDFHICKTQEEFLGGNKRIIISKEFCKLLLKYKLIKYNTWQITPLEVKKIDN
jgi:hypothetical protein